GQGGKNSSNCFLQIPDFQQDGSDPSSIRQQLLRNRAYTNKACLRSVDVLVRAGGLGLYSPRLLV
ncbi:MAG TPA: hypothetical protein V6D48_20240, partial [Oculatellaceae cyanobacterium]